MSNAEIRGKRKLSVLVVVTQAEADIGVNCERVCECVTVRVVSLQMYRRI